MLGNHFWTVNTRHTINKTTLWFVIFVKNLVGGQFARALVHRASEKRKLLAWEENVQFVLDEQMIFFVFYLNIFAFAYPKST